MMERSLRVSTKNGIDSACVVAQLDNIRIAIWKVENMKFNEFSYRHGKEILKLQHPSQMKEIVSILGNLAPFPHGEKKGVTVKDHLVAAFLGKGWEKEGKVDFKTEKKDYVDLCKWNIAIEMEFSRFEMFFRDFFRFMLLYQRRKIDLGVIITLDEMAYQRWEGEAKSYKSARASFQKLTDFLNGDYCSIIDVPLWCIGIE